MKTLIKVNDVEKIYHTRKKTIALDKVTFAIQEGEIIGIIGMNGAGKTTLIKILVDLLNPSSGEVSLLGEHSFTRKLKQQLAYSGQDSEVSGYWRLTIRENLMYFLVYLYQIPAEEASRRINWAFAELEALDLLDKFYSTLSGGQKQLMVCLRAILTFAKIIFLDEPSKSLDPVTYKKFTKLLLRIVQEHSVCVFLTTHRMNEVEDLCNRVIVLDKGKILYDGNISALKMIYHHFDSVKMDIEHLDDEIIHDIGQIPGFLRYQKNHSDYYFFFTDPFIGLKHITEIMITKKLQIAVSLPVPKLEDALERMISGGKP